MVETMKEAIERGMQEAAKEAADLRAVEQGMAGLDTEKDGSFFQELRASEAEMEAEKKAAAEEKARAAEKKAEEMAKAMEEKRRKREEWEDGKVWKGVMKGKIPFADIIIHPSTFSLIFVMTNTHTHNHFE
ncbi:MAG: hypothetical protein LQ350_004630 [Teloschistes chrysophthalmus]|nr:MAG: hypothetical protein LQ350_004630 [Niorma chrysophthalma]